MISHWIELNSTLRRVYIHVIARLLLFSGGNCFARRERNWYFLYNIAYFPHSAYQLPISWIRKEKKRNEKRANKYKKSYLRICSISFDVRHQLLHTFHSNVWCSIDFLVLLVSKKKKKEKKTKMILKMKTPTWVCLSISVCGTDRCTSFSLWKSTLFVGYYMNIVC